jgi:hypothetical protein
VFLDDKKDKGTPIWCIQKNYTFNNIETIGYEWHIQDSLSDNRINTDGIENYINNNETLFVRNGNLIVRAFRQNGTYLSARLLSKTAFTPSNHKGGIDSYWVSA